MELQTVKSWEERDHSLILYFEKGMATITFAEKDVIRFRYTDSGAWNGEEDFIVHACVNNVAFQLDTKENSLELSTGELRAELQLNPFSIAISNKKGKEILSSTGPFMSIEHNRKVARFTLTEHEGIYGLGQDPMANLNQRDKERRMWQQWGSNGRSGNGGVPFMMSTNGYGILLNSAWPSRFAIGKAEVAEFNRMGEIMAPAPRGWDQNSGETDPNTSAILLEGDNKLDLFIICRENFDEILKGYYGLTGFAPMLPKWAFGFMQCKNRYRSQNELLTIARIMREKEIPCDVLIIDWLWFREFGDLVWDQENWPDVTVMFQELSDMGFKVMQAQHPFLSPSGLKFEEFKNAAFLNKVPEGKRYTFDHSNPDARKAWWNEFKRLYKQGIKGYWTDMGELEEHFPGTESYLGGREKVHNIYSLLWAKGLYDGQRGDFGQRVITLARTTYAGMQKYGTTLWSGDIDASWEVLKSQVAVGQGVCMSGMPYWTTDIGGFITNMDFTPELYVRWLQWGVFCPLFRTHGTKPENEPWSYGKQTEDIVKEYIELRYKLIPYIYSCAHKITTEGKALMRAMVMDYGSEPKAVERTEQFMFGPNILVAPVLDKGVREMEVYLPEGDWYDYWTDRKYEGKNFIRVSAPLNKIPLFVKSGSVIPMSAVTQSIDETLNKDITVHVYPGKNTVFELYDDDGQTYEYENDWYVKTRIEYMEDAVKSVKIYPVHVDESLLSARDYTIVLHDVDRPKEIFIGNDMCKNWEYLEPNRTLTITCRNLSTNTSFEVFIKQADILEKTDQQKRLGDVHLFADTDMESHGKVTIHLTIDTFMEYKDTIVTAKLIVPEGWTITKSDRSDHDINSYWKLQIYQEEQQETTIYPGANLQWEVHPMAEALPSLTEGVIEVEFLNEKNCIRKTRMPISWGTGFLTRWSMVGSFENADNAGFDATFEPERNPHQPFYEHQSKKLTWIRDSDNEFNCFGYVDLRRLGAFSKGEAIQGLSYCRCKVWSNAQREAFLELSAESSIKVWVNHEEVFQSNKITINERSTAVSLKEGWNQIIVKAAVQCDKPYSGREYGFNLRLVDKQGQPVNDLLYMP
ncbi:TIM-barrel domain-containing protein [Neobacillus sp. NPDC093127]|uniref:glycoside hydrolase family 31 protein n=1 Tax=Neobacillus sp. NPDC093127 TaxID=3364296 RepID=UPI00381B21EE